MKLKVEFTKKDLGHGITAVTAPMKEQIYVVKGDTHTLVVDTGMGIGSLKSYLDTFCDKPYIVVNTHGHPDHSGGNAEFEGVFLHPDDVDTYKKMVTFEFRAEDVRSIFGKDGDVFIEAMQPYAENYMFMTEGYKIDIGGRVFDIYKLGGHTKGSVVFYEEKTRTLIGGDACGLKETWLFLPESLSVEEYHKNLVDFKVLGLKIDRMLSGHIPNVTDGTLLDKKIILTEKILSGEIVGRPYSTFAGDGLFAEYEDTSILYDGDRLHL